MSARPRTWAVVIADMVRSEDVLQFSTFRDQTLRSLSKRHLDDKRVLGSYTVTAWDEFQNVLTSPEEIPRVVWDLHLAFWPGKLRVGIGVGDVDNLPDPGTPINKVSSGEGFIRAREALSSIATQRKFSVRTALRSGNRQTDQVVNLIYLLIDTVLDGQTDRQWETIISYEMAPRQGDVARMLKVRDESTVSRSLRRGNYWQIVETQKGLRDILKWQLVSRNAIDQ